MAQKQFLHELLKEDQEPFRLKSYISDRRSQLKKSYPPPASALQLKKRNPDNILRNRACFLSFQNSPDVLRSPFPDLPSPAKSPRGPPNGAVFLHIPSRTAALLVEAAMRIQKQQQSRSKVRGGSKSAGLGLFGSFLKRLKDRSKSKKRAIGDSDLRIEVETVRSSCNCSNRRLSSANWTESNEDKSLDFEASTSSCGSDCSLDFCASPFRFNLRKSPSSSGQCTPEFCSPAASPSRRVNQDKENYKSRSSDNTVQGDGDEEEDKEQCSPVSVFDPPFEDAHGDANDEDDYDHDLQCNYENVQRAQKQLLYRLQRFEKLAELDPIELERKLVEGSDDEGGCERQESHGGGDDDDDQVCGEQSVETVLTMPSDMKKLVYDLIDEEKNEAVYGCDNEAVMRRIHNKLDSWREVEANTIDMMIGFDFNREFGRWTKFNEQVEEISAEIEVAIYGLLVDELSDELFYMHGHY